MLAAFWGSFSCCVPWLLALLCWAHDEYSRAAKKQRADISRDTVLLFRLLESCLTPSPTWKSCQAVAIHICVELSEGETASAEEEPGEANEEPIPWKRVCGESENAGNLPEQSPGLVATLSKDTTWKKWKEGKMRGKEENELTVPAIKASSRLRLMGSHAHSSQLYFSLMSQVSVSGSCKLAAPSHSHYWLLLQTFPAHLLPSASLRCLYSVTLSILSTDAPCFAHDGIC